MRLKSGKEKRLKSGKELAVAAPITTKAAKDTAIAGTRFEAPSSAASGCLSPWSGVSATRVPYRITPVARFFLAADQQNKKEPLRGRSSGDPRVIAHPNRLKSWAYMVNDQLFPGPLGCEAISFKDARSFGRRPAPGHTSDMTARNRTSAEPPRADTDTRALDARINPRSAACQRVRSPSPF
jgi:hypothetical protein